MKQFQICRLRWIANPVPARRVPPFQAAEFLPASFFRQGHIAASFPVCLQWCSHRGHRSPVLSPRSSTRAFHSAAADAGAGPGTAEVRKEDLGTYQFDDMPADVHIHLLIQALQRCGINSENIRSSIAWEEGSVASICVEFPHSLWSVRIEGCHPHTQRATETVAQASLRAARHAAAHVFLNNAKFVATLESTMQARQEAKKARAEQLRLAQKALPTMSELVVARFIQTGHFAIRKANLSIEELEKIPISLPIAVDTEGLDVSRDDWQRAWLVQLAFRTKDEKGGVALVLLAKSDEDMDMFAAWMVNRARLGSTFYIFDKRADAPAIFRDGTIPAPLLPHVVDLKAYGPSLHALAGEKLLGREVRKQSRMSESLSFLAETQDVTELQVLYAAADAITTLELGKICSSLEVPVSGS